MKMKHLLKCLVFLQNGFLLNPLGRMIVEKRERRQREIVLDDSDGFSVLYY